MKKDIIVIILFFGLGCWQCSKIETKPDLKQSIKNGVENINLAVGKISESMAYDLLSVKYEEGKSAECQYLIDTIVLKDVAGIYDYQPDLKRPYHKYFPASLFKKTGESDHMIVNMPHRLMFKPRYLHNYCTCDPILKNNFTIDASDYHFYFTVWNSFDYKLAAGFTLDEEDLGACEITSVFDKQEGNSYMSKYTFPEGYNITVEFMSGDTTLSSFALKEGEEILLMETSVFIKNENQKVERQYILTIGDVDIRKSTGVDSIQVFLYDVLQQKAAVKIIDKVNDVTSICHGRDLLLTFDDGTTANLSELIKPAHETLKSLVKSLGDMYFAKHIIDYIAVSIYYNTH